MIKLNGGWGHFGHCRKSVHIGTVLHMRLLNLPFGHLAFLVEMRHQVLGLPSLPCATFGGKADLDGGQKATVALLPGNRWRKAHAHWAKSVLRGVARLLASLSSSLVPVPQMLCNIYVCVCFSLLILFVVVIFAFKSLFPVTGCLLLSFLES